MSTVPVTLPDGSVHDIAPGVSAGEVLRDSLGKGSIAALIDGVEVDLATQISSACTIDQILPDCEEGLHILRHSCAHLGHRPRQQRARRVAHSFDHSRFFAHLTTHASSLI